MFAPKGKAEFVTEKVTRLFSGDVSLTGVFRNDIAFSLSIMIRKYFDCTSKGKELLMLIEPELDTSRLKDVIDFEVDFIKKSYEMELLEKKLSIAEKNKIIAEMDLAIAERNMIIVEMDLAIAEKKKLIFDKKIKTEWNWDGEDIQDHISLIDMEIGKKDEEINILRAKLKEYDVE